MSEGAEDAQETPYDEDQVGDDFFPEVEQEGEDGVEGFHPHVCINNGSRPRHWLAYPHWTVQEFTDAYIRMELQASVQQGKNPRLDLMYRGVTMDKSRTLGSYDFNTSYHVMYGFVHLKGGALAPAKRRMNTRHSLLKGRGSRKPDCINSEDKEPRARLNCGCVLCAETAYNWIVHSFSTNPLMSDLVCPNPKCNKPVAWPIIACIGALTQEEFNRYTAMLKRRRKAALRKVSTKCPYCQSNVSRPDSLRANRVQCPLCDKPDFCFSCSLPWRGSGRELCGNSICTSQQLQNLLDTCDTTNNFGDPCPKFRACPRCLQFVMYREACKHISCPNKECNHQFCLVCLNNYPCNSSTCKVAPRQKLN